MLEALGSDANGLSSERQRSTIKSAWRKCAPGDEEEKCMACLCRAVCRSSGYYSYHCCDYFNVSGNVEHDCYILVITMNAILGTVQHEKAEKSLASLKTLSAPTAKVLRGGVKGRFLLQQVVKGIFCFLRPVIW